MPAICKGISYPSAIIFRIIIVSGIIDKLHFVDKFCSQMELTRNTKERISYMFIIAALLRGVRLKINS